MSLPEPLTALIVIDLQVGVLERCFDAAGVLARCIALVERARRADVPVVWVRHEDDELPRDSAAWQLAPGLLPQAHDILVFKRWRDAFTDTHLRAELQRLGVKRLVMAGAQSDYCIRTATQRAAADGYSVILVSDAHTTTDAELGAITLSGEQIVAHTNSYFAGLRYPGQVIGIATHDRVSFAAG